MSTPKRHHYLPQSYLRSFARDEVIWVYDRSLNAIRAQKVVDTAVISHFNSIENPDGSKDPWVETELAKIDGLIPRITEQLLAGEKLDEAGRFDLSFIAALMMTRPPDFHEGIQRVEGKLIKRFAQSMFRSEDDAARSLAKWKAEDPGAPDLDPKEVFRFYSEGKFDVQIHRNRSIEHMLRLSPEFGNTLARLNVGVMHAPKRFAFVTTDRPFVIMPPQDSSGLPRWGGIGLLTPGAKKYLSLSSEIAVVFGDPGENFTHFELRSDYMKGVNGIIGSMADRFLFGRDEALVEAWSKRLRMAALPAVKTMDVS